MLFAFATPVSATPPHEGSIPRKEHGAPPPPPRFHSPPTVVGWHAFCSCDCYDAFCSRGAHHRPVWARASEVTARVQPPSGVSADAVEWCGGVSSVNWRPPAVSNPGTVTVGAFSVKGPGAARSPLWSARVPSTVVGPCLR